MYFRGTSSTYKKPVLRIANHRVRLQGIATDVASVKHALQCLALRSVIMFMYGRTMESSRARHSTTADLLVYKSSSTVRTEQRRKAPMTSQYCCLA
jgi:hypothetical protein